jgi:ABC-2 type transport system permease protein
METLRDTWLIFRRALQHTLRNPVWVVIGLVQPILYLALFGPLLKPITGLKPTTGAPGFPPGDAWQVFVPGLLVQLGLFATAFVGFGLIAEWRMGVVERMRVTPVSRLALLLGRVLRDVVVLVVQAVLLLAVGAAFGLRAPLLGMAIGLGLVLVMSAGVASMSYALGLLTKDEDAFAPLLNFVSVPVLLLSGILLPMSLAPGWLDLLSRLNPLRYVVDALREAFLGRYATPTVATGAAVAAATAVTCAAIGARTFRRENA